MKIRSDFVLRQVADTWIVLAIGAVAADFKGMLTLNESGVLLWKALENGADRARLADALMAEYIVDRDQALVDVDDFLNKLQSVGCLEV